MRAPTDRAARLRRLALGAWLALLALVLGWEAWGAPATPLPRAFWMVVKGLPLAAALPWLVRDNPRPYVLAALLALLYFSNGIATAYHAARTGAGPALAYGLLEVAAATLFVVGAGLYARLSSPRARAGTGS